MQAMTVTNSEKVKALLGTQVRIEHISILVDLIRISWNKTLGGGKSKLCDNINTLLLLLFWLYFETLLGPLVCD